MHKNTNNKVIYTALFLTAESKNKLLQAIPPVFEKIYAHHLTLEFKPINGIEDLDIGKVHKVTIAGYVIDKKIGVQACLVKEKIGNNKYPHITIAAKENVKPVNSNVAIEKAISNKNVVLLETPIEIEAIEGYFDGTKPIISNL